MDENLILEVGTEEIPARFLPDIITQLKEQAERRIKEQRLKFKNINTYGSPRRLVLSIIGLSEVQDDKIIERIGPAVKVAIGRDNLPTKAAFGFAASCNLKYEELEIKKTDKGEYLYARIHEKGKKSEEILPGILEDTLKSLSFQKPMRWGAGDTSFIRPIRWILALRGENAINIQFGNIKSGRFTYGNRSFGNSPINVNSVDDYWEAMNQGKVVVDHYERAHLIRNQINSLASQNNGKIIDDEELLKEVVHLVEYPTSYCGHFSEDFLEVPEKVLVITMKTQLKYFPLHNNEGNLLPVFINVSNGNPDHINKIRIGNERVLKARLSDARYYFKEDLKTPLSSRVEKLKHVLYQKELGNYFEKVQRIICLSDMIAEELKVETRVRQIVQRSAYLAKADLVTEMLGEKEYTSLQGYMGRIYALHSGEMPEVAEAVYEHYMPRFAEDSTPKSLAGAIVAIADKLDTICGCFLVDLIPTGSQDPYGLRRGALGLLRIGIDHNFRLNLRELVEGSIKLFDVKLKTDNLTGIANQILEFFKTRTKTFLTDSGFSYDIVQAVMDNFMGDISDAMARCRALNSMRKESGFDKIILYSKRVSNILKEINTFVPLKTELFQKHEELKLHEKIVWLWQFRTLNFNNEENYKDFLKKLLTIGDAIDDFFNVVMVMVEDVELKNNRLSLLSNLKNLFMSVADFSKIVLEAEN